MEMSGQFHAVAALPSGKESPVPIDASVHCMYGTSCRLDLSQSRTVGGVKQSPGVRFEALAVVKIQAEVFWVVMLGSIVVGYQCFRGPCCLHLLSQHYMVSQPRRPQLESSHLSHLGHSECCLN
jgi:hypothetical protein